MSRDFDLRTSFNQVARLYHAIRPRYPEILFDTLVNVTRLDEDARLLEIGPGTGQATEALAKRGYKITAIELGGELAELAREVLRKYKNVEIIRGAFEDTHFQPESFDLIYAATAFHWIKPDFRFTKPYTLLKQDGFLAIIHTNHVSDEKGDKFFFASQPIYKKYGLDDLEENFHIPSSADLQAERLDDKLFNHVFYDSFPLIIRYTADEYAQLISTYSPIISLSPEMRLDFLKEISHLIRVQFGGSINKHFAMTLTVAVKKNR